MNDLSTTSSLTYHVNNYLLGLLSAFKTGRLEISDKYRFDLPSITSKADWESLVSEFLGNAKEFAEGVEAMEYKTFDQLFIDEKYGTFQRNIEGVIEHCYYHMGQIFIIKKH